MGLLAALPRISGWGEWGRNVVVFYDENVMVELEIGYGVLATILLQKTVDSDSNKFPRHRQRLLYSFLVGPLLHPPRL